MVQYKDNLLGSNPTGYWLFLYVVVGQDINQYLADWGGSLTAGYTICGNPEWRWTVQIQKEKSKTRKIFILNQGTASEQNQSPHDGWRWIRTTQLTIPPPLHPENIPHQKLASTCQINIDILKVSDSRLVSSRFHSTTLLVAGCSLASQSANRRQGLNRHSWNGRTPSEATNQETRYGRALARAAASRCLVQLDWLFLWFQINCGAVVKENTTRRRLLNVYRSASHYTNRDEAVLAKNS
ncbi:hypothetical protein LSH36_824g03058 [Paralvinella palmiformis]|uniref:Uncharacterized protein n=1 Tax=Paralvinella palmiformis TaxID=53620 RepID=A0AAD9IZB0_9ANNE|nr:hypothetical protein LSH36_824g03058 [Paralvinella palmiformis]